MLDIALFRGDDVEEIKRSESRRGRETDAIVDNVIQLDGEWRKRAWHKMHFFSVQTLTHIPLLCGASSV